MIEIISKANDAFGNGPVSAEERLYVSTALGSSFRSFGGEVFGATVRFEERPTGEWVCNVEVETRVTLVETEASAPSRMIAFALAAEGLDRRIFSAIYNASQHAA